MNYAYVLTLQITFQTDRRCNDTTYPKGHASTSLDRWYFQARGQNGTLDTGSMGLAQAKSKTKRPVSGDESLILCIAHFDCVLVIPDPLQAARDQALAEGHPRRLILLP